MTLVADIVTRLRTEFLDDAIAASEEDYRWQTADIVAALNWAHNELARRLLLIEDFSTAEVCEISVDADGDGNYPRIVSFHEKVLRVTRAIFPGITTPLIRTTRGVLDQYDSGWEARTGTPTHYVVDVNSKKITFNRQPTSGGTVTLGVKRKPITIFTTADALATADPAPTLTPEFDYDDELCHAALVKLYLKDDKKVFDPKRSQYWASFHDDNIRSILREQAALSPDIHIMRPE